MTVQPNRAVQIEYPPPYAPVWRVAVIDIGSNSVRLVIYEGAARAPLPIFNEKIIAALGARVRSTGKLDPDGVKMALANLPRFKAAVEAAGAAELHIFATSAVRDADDGPAFVRKVAKQTGMQIRVLSGDEEARLAGMGIISGTPFADGVVGDLGGGSLELVHLNQGRILDAITLPLGALSLNEIREKGESVSEVVRKALKDVPWIKEIGGRNFYAIGGAWRALAKIHMAQHPALLRIIDGLTVPAGDMSDLARLIARQSDKALLRVPTFPAKRLPTVRAAATVMRNVIRIASPKRVVFSARGVREGVLYESLDPIARREDPLLVSAQHIATRFGRFATLGPPLATWTDAIFADEPEEEMRLRHAVCLMSDLGWIDHPDHRATHGFHRLLTLPVQGLDHAGRAYLAHAIHARFGGSDDPQFDEIAERLGLEADARHRARALGAALRLGFALSAGQPEILQQTSLRRTRSSLVLTTPEKGGAFGGDTPTSLLATLAEAFELKPRFTVAST